MAALTSPDGIVSATVVVGNQEADGVYPIQITQLAPTGQPIAIEVNGVRVYEETANGGTGSEG